MIFAHNTRLGLIGNFIMFFYFFYFIYLSEEIKLIKQVVRKNEIIRENERIINLSNQFSTYPNNNSVSDKSEYYKNYSQFSPEESIVTKVLRIVESEHELGSNCTAGTHLNLGEGVVDRYAQERFRTEAEVAVNRANMLTRLWKYSGNSVMDSEYLLHSSVLSMVEFNENIFAAGNCYDKNQYKNYWLFCPYAYRLPDGLILVKDLAVEYNYLDNASEWFFIVRKNAEKVIRNNDSFSIGYHTYTWNDTSHSTRYRDEILKVRYEDGRWSKPYYDCGGGNIWMLTYTVPFFGFKNGTYFFKGTSGIDIDLRKVDIDQCPLPQNTKYLNIFAASDKCKPRTTKCVSISGLGFRRGSYRCECLKGFYFPNISTDHNWFDGTVIEEKYENLILGKESKYNLEGSYECLPCEEGCDSCVDSKPCILQYNWFLRSIILGLTCSIIGCLFMLMYFTYRYKHLKVVRAASPVLLTVIAFGAFFIYLTTVVAYFRPNVYTCTIKLWLREIGFSLTYGALMLKTWRIAMIFRIKSAKLVKITDMDLLKKLAIILMVFGIFLLTRTLISPVNVNVVKTSDNLKVYLCETVAWDHWFTIMEGAFLVWGIRLCIIVRKAPSEFNESRFISMAIYNEFLLSVFLKVSMFFLQSTANPDLMYVIYFSHSQITVTLLLCFIFGSKAYMIYKRGSEDIELASTKNIKIPTGKFLCKPNNPASSTSYHSTSSINLSGIVETNSLMDEFEALCRQLDDLKEKCIRNGETDIFDKLKLMQESSNVAITCNSANYNHHQHHHPYRKELLVNKKDGRKNKITKFTRKLSQTIFSPNLSPIKSTTVNESPEKRLNDKSIFISDNENNYNNSYENNCMSNLERNQVNTIVIFNTENKIPSSEVTV